MLLPISRQKNVSSTDLNSVNQKIDLLMTMMNDIAPVVKTLNKVYEDSLIAESDEDIDDSDVGPPTKQKNWQQIQLRCPWESLTPSCPKLIPRKRQALQFLRKLQKLWTVFCQWVLMNQLPPKERRPLIGLKIVSYLQPPLVDPATSSSLGLSPFLFRDRHIRFRGNYS